MAEPDAEEKDDFRDLSEQNRLAIARIREELERLKARLEDVEREKWKGEKR